MKIPNGNIVPTFSFFSKGGIVIEEQMKLLTSHILQNGADGIFVLGSTGSGLYFMDKSEEKRKLINAVAEANKKDKKPILVGIYGENPKEIAADAELILNIIKDVYFVIPPPVKRQLTEEMQRELYSGVFDRISQPSFLYNNPSRFGKTEISPGLLEYLKKFDNFIGLKDSSESDENKIEYLKHLDERCSISCGKEGSIGKFLLSIPIEKRKYAGMVPSISNLVNSFQSLWKNALAGKDAEVSAQQKIINEYRGKIYHSEIGNGKAQRGGKIALSYLVKKINPKLSLSTLVAPDLEAKVEDSVIKRIQTTVDWCLENSHIDIGALK